MDITPLYTVIPNGKGLLALKQFFDLHTMKEPSSETLHRLAVNPQLFFICRQLLQTNLKQWHAHGYQTGAQLCQSSRVLH